MGNIGTSELILIFDGCRDRSPEIGHALSAQDPRIKIYENHIAVEEIKRI